jgi:hypothetical protein
VVAYNAHGGAPSLLRRLEPTAIVLHTTFLATRWIEPFPAWRERSRWIGEVGCPVLALPQDDYDHAEILDQWLEELSVTAIFTALAGHTDVLYPRAARRAAVRAVLTGYVPNDASAPQAEGETRAFDVVYRATALPYWYGSLGLLKAEVGRAAAAAADRANYRADISLDAESVLTGEAWLRFLASGRATVGAESGASVVDPDGSLRRQVTDYLQAHPAASYDEVTRAVPEHWDERRFGVVSPRHFEAALTRTAQVLVAGRYSGVLRAGEHYLPVREDLSDIGEALAAVSDPDVSEAIVERSFADIVASGKYAYSRLTAALAQELPAEERLRPTLWPGLIRAASGSVSALVGLRNALARL